MSDQAESAEVKDDVKEESAPEKAVESPPAEGKEEEKKADKKPPGGKKSGNVANFHGRFQIHCDKPLPDYDHGEAKAYEAHSTGKDNSVFFALVCDRSLVPRRREANIYDNIINPNIAALVRHGVVHWPVDGTDRFVFIYRNTLGKPILKPGEKRGLGWRVDDVVETVVQPMVNVLLDFRDKDFVHGSICPDNLFDGGARGKIEKIVLGDCLSIPASSYQSVEFETIERSMADPLARGMPILAGDLYALGVTIATLARHKDYVAGMSDEEIIRKKIEHGSYLTITGNERFKGNIIELLRGLLIDDANQRWTIDEVVAWLGGARQTPKQIIREKKAQRPLTFNNEKYSLASLLAMDINVNPQEVMRIVESEELEQWMQRSLEDDAATKRVEDALNASRDKGAGAGYEDRLIANMSAALDPRAPLRYKNLRLFGDGIGPALAEAMALKRDVNGYVEVFAYGIALNWTTTYMNTNVDLGAMISKLDSCRTYVKQSKVGYGIERCVYYLCNDAQCLSPMLKDYYVRGPEELMEAYEDMCQQGKAKEMLLDRHSVAFMCVRDPKSVEGYLYDLNGPEPYKIILGNLKTLATIQKRSNLDAFPGIAKHLADKMKPVYARYHDKDVREKLQRNIDRYAAQGDLIQMAGLLDNVQLLDKDFDNFKKALAEYSDLKAEYKKLDEALQDESTFGITTGHEIAAVLASILGGSIVLIMAFVVFTGMGGF